MQEPAGIGDAGIEWAEMLIGEEFKYLKYKRQNQLIKNRLLAAGRARKPSVYACTGKFWQCLLTFVENGKPQNLL